MEKISVARLRKLFRNLTLNQEYAMYRYTFLATIVAASLFATPTLAAPSGAKANATPPAATATAKAKPKAKKAKAAKTTTAYYPVTSWIEYAKMADTYESWYRNETQKKWSTVTVKESAQLTLEGDADKVDVLLDQIIEVLEGIGETTPSDTKTAFEKYMEDKDCKYLGDKKISKGGATFTVSKYSKGCVSLFKALEDEFEARKAKANPGDRLDNAVHTMGVAKKKYKGTHRIAMAHKAMTILTLALPESERPWPLTDADLSTFFNGKKSCIFMKDGSDKHCGKIEKVESDGVTVDGKKLPFDQIHTICLGDEEECEDMSGGGADDWSGQHLVSVGVQGVARAIDAEDYENAGIYGAMAVAQLNLHDNFGFVLGIGLGRIFGQPTLGVTKADSRTVFLAEVGASALLGEISWPVAPRIGAKMTIQGAGIGAEGEAGFVIWPDGPVNISALLAMGYYTTGRQLFVNPDKDTASFGGFGAGGKLIVTVPLPTQ